MSVLQLGADELLLGLDQLLWGGADFPHPHSTGGEAALVHTIAALRYPNGERIFLWSGPYDLVLPGDFSSLRSGITSWNALGSTDYSSRGVPAEFMPTGAAHDPQFRLRVALISSTERKFWHNIAAITTFVEVDLSGLGRATGDPAPLIAPWLPEGHQIYPVGGATILEEGTLVIGCWAGPERIADDAAYNGFRYEGTGRWCVYHHRLRDPFPGVEKIPAMPVSVGDANIQMPFPTADARSQLYDLRALHAVEGRNLTAWKEAVARFGVGGAQETLDDEGNPFHVFPYLDDEVVYFFHTNDLDRDDIFSGLYHMAAPTTAARAPASTWADDAYPLQPDKTRGIVGAPTWDNRVLYGSMSDIRTPEHNGSWWLLRNGGVSVASSLEDLAPTRFSLSANAISGFRSDEEVRIPSSALGDERTAYRAVVPRIGGSVLLGSPQAASGLIRRDSPSTDDFIASSKHVSMNPSLVSVSPITQQTGINDTRRVSVSMYWPDEISAGHALEDPGPVEVEIDMVWSPDAGGTWHRLDRPFIGTVSSPALVPNDNNAFVYQFEIATHDSDVDRGVTAYWTNASQQSVHPGDRFFEGREAIDEGARLLRWPPL